MMNTYLIETDETNPHRNLAYEEGLLFSPPPDAAVLFLWQNAHTVVIGAGQNAWRECDVTRLQEDGGTLARRSSGGGAVYHDLGNLNFSFIVPRGVYDVARQLSVVLNAVKSLGIPAVAEGRNDLTADGRKFSGNAFRLLQSTALHHGTLLISSDLSMVSKYLTVSNDKLEAKGVKSVRSRVTNLSEIKRVTVDEVKRSLKNAFFEEYGAGESLRAEDFRPDGLGALIDRYESWDWNFGASPKGQLVLSRRFDFGGVELHISLKGGEIDDVRAYTDAMDEHLSDVVSAALLGCRWEAKSVGERLRMFELPDIAKWLEAEI